MIKHKVLTVLKVCLFLFLLFTIHYSLFTREVLAVCPVCTIAVGAGLGISRALGIDDAVTSVWIGGLILSMSFWFIDWLDKKKFKSMEKFSNPSIKPYRDLAITSLFYFLTLLPLYFSKYIGRPLNSIYGIDKILFGTFWGSLAFILAKWADEKVRKVKGKQLFIYQRVIFPLTTLIITSIILELVLRST